MQPDQTAPFLRKVLATYNSRRPEAFDALLTEDCTLIRDGAEARGREAVKRVLGQLYRAIPDLEYRIDDSIFAGDKATIRWEGHGTHRGEYQGVAPTGSEMSYTGITIYEMRGDLVARIWVSTNLLERLRKASELARQESQADAVH
jgi:predicted ester cyclase